MILACDSNCYQCNTAGRGLCDIGQCHPRYAITTDKTCLGMLISLDYDNQSRIYKCRAYSPGHGERRLSVFQSQILGVTQQRLGSYNTVHTV